MTPQQKLQRGDLFEASCSEWIISNLPQYADVWSRWIGNDGKSRPLAIKGLSPEQEKNRMMFAQCHYSLALYAHLFDKHANTSIAALQKYVDEGTLKTLEAYLSVSFNFTVFITFIGQICDMVEQIAYSLNANEIFIPIVAFGKERSNAIHTARIPFIVNAYGFQIPRIGKRDPQETDWTQGVLWEQMERPNFHDLKTWMGDTRSALFETLRKKVYRALIEAAQRVFPHGIKQEIQKPRDGFVPAFSTSPPPVAWHIRHPPSGER